MDSPTNLKSERVQVTQKRRRVVAQLRAISKKLRVVHRKATAINFPILEVDLLHEAQRFQHAARKANARITKIAYNRGIQNAEEKGK